jgi:hypothetical protein
MTYDKSQQILEDLNHTIFPYYKWIKLEINKIRKPVKFTNKWKLINALSNRKWVEEEIERQFLKYLEKNENTIYQKEY